jgi:hypothetical protein
MNSWYSGLRRALVKLLVGIDYKGTQVILRDIILESFNIAMLGKC